MTFSVSRRVAAPAEDVWALLTDTEKWSAWGPSITGVEPAVGGLATGSRGKVRTVRAQTPSRCRSAPRPGRCGPCRGCRAQAVRMRARSQARMRARMPE